MASEHASKKGKKGKTMALMDFLSTPADTESWAEPETSILPSAPASANPDSRISETSSALTFSSRYSSSPRSHPVFTPSFKPIDMDKVPTTAPFNAFIGNLPFDVEQQDVVDLLKDDVSVSNSIANVKLIRDREGKLKGFGYIEFTSREALQKALERQGALSIHGRSIRIDIAEPSHGDRSGFSKVRDTTPGSARHNRYENRDIDRSSITPDASWRRSASSTATDDDRKIDHYQRSSDIHHSKLSVDASNSNRFFASNTTSNEFNGSSSWRKSESVTLSENSIVPIKDVKDKHQSNEYHEANRHLDSRPHRRSQGSSNFDNPTITDGSWRNRT